MIRFFIADGQILPLKFVKYESEYYRNQYYHLLAISFLLTTLFSAIEFISYNLESLLFSNKNGIVSIYLLCTSIIFVNLIFLYFLNKELFELIKNKLTHQLFDNYKFYINFSIFTVLIINLLVLVITAKEVGFDRTGNVLELKSLLYFIFYSSNSSIPTLDFFFDFLLIFGVALLLSLLVSFVYKIRDKFLIYRAFSIYMKSLSMMYVAATWIELFEISNDIFLQDLYFNLLILLSVYLLTFPLKLIDKKKEDSFDTLLFLKPVKSSSSKKMTYSVFAVVLVGFLFANYSNLDTLNLPYLLSSAGCFFLLILTIKNKMDLEDNVRERTFDLYTEKEKAEHLLENILPKYVIKELQEDGVSPPRKFEKASVLFTDFVSFTEISSTIKPYELVRELNDMFTEFDKIIEHYQCDRIKTIGDSYMAVSGLNNNEDNTSENIVLAALDFVDYLKKRNKNSIVKWKIRIGIAQGEVVAGIVGVKKYLFDVFGETVNIASRLESKSESMRVNVSSLIYYELRDSYSFETRGYEELKGLGNVKMHFVVGKKYEEK